MEPLEKALEELQARTIEELLARLAELQPLRAKGEPVRPPKVTLHLRSGRELLGLETLRTKVRKVRLATGPAAQVRLEQQTLQLTTTQSVLGWQSKEDLHTAIEKVL